MPEILFKGKEYVYNHHLTVPYRPLVVDQARSVGSGDLAGNLVIHGDNLHALKALLPRYAGQVDLVFIDPPYNTGNEGWCYNDNVSSPIMKEWLASNPVDGEDMLRHDKWLCMMWPRLVLLRELMSQSGSIWITLDDNEVHRARMVLDEIFGATNFVATCVWRKNYAPKSTTRHFSEDHDYVLIFAKNAAGWSPNLLQRTESQNAAYKNPDSDPRGPWRPDNLSARNYYSKGSYAIRCPGGRLISGPPKGRYWAISEDKFWELDRDNRIWWGADGNNIPAPKTFLSEVRDGRVPQTFWDWTEVGHTQDAKKLLLEMGMMDAHDTITPKPVALVERVIQLGASADSVVLDSFAGSGTTAHAVLKANARDGGSRKFILVEGEDYADTLTAERVRRAIKGYAWVGTQRETLLEEKITWTQFRKADEWLKKVEALKAAEGFAQGDLADQGTDTPRRFDRLNVEVKDGVLRVEGEKKVSERTPGLGGEFAFCTLGDPLDVRKLLSGESLPAHDALGAWLFHTATGGTLPPLPKDAPPWYLGEAADAHVWLIYEPALGFLKSPEAALTLSRAMEFSAWARARAGGKGAVKRSLVFAPAKYLSNKQLAEHGIDYAALPFALFRQG